jgi:cytochrome c553
MSNIQYPICILDKSELAHHLNVGELERLTDQDMQDIASAMMQELHDLSIWDFAAFVARLKLSEKER